MERAEASQMRGEELLNLRISLKEKKKAPEGALPLAPIRISNPG
jgi:hypothetical protein